MYYFSCAYTYIYLSMFLIPSTPIIQSVILEVSERIETSTARYAHLERIERKAMTGYKMSFIGLEALL